MIKMCFRNWGVVSLWTVVFPLMPTAIGMSCIPSNNYNEFGISVCEPSSPTIYLVDNNEKQVKADGVILIGNEQRSDISLVIPDEDYMLNIHIDNTDHKKTFSMYYIVKISEYESGYTYQIKWKQITINPNLASQDFGIPLQFEEGIYKIDVFFWSDLNSPKIVMANSYVANPIVKALTIDTITRYVGVPDDVTLLNYTQEFVHRDNAIDSVIIDQVIIGPQGRAGGNYGGLEFKDEFTLVIVSEKAIYGDIVYLDPIKQEWIIVKQSLLRDFKLIVQIPQEQSTRNFKWGFFVLNPNIEPVRANITHIITNNF